MLLLVSRRLCAIPSLGVEVLRWCDSMKRTEKERGGRRRREEKEEKERENTKAKKRKKEEKQRNEFENKTKTQESKKKYRTGKTQLSFIYLRVSKSELKLDTEVIIRLICEILEM